MIIKNFGHHWERNLVQWGYQGHGGKGHLNGYKKAKSSSVDFREQIGIYVLYNSNLLPVYIGQAGNGNARLFDRLKAHDSDHLWNRWQHFSWFGFRAVTKASLLSNHDKIGKKFGESGGTLLNQIEGILIAAMEPRLNKQGAKWNGVEEYHQDVDDELEMPTAQYLAQKLEKIETLVSNLSTTSKRKR